MKKKGKKKKGVIYSCECLYVGNLCPSIRIWEPGRLQFIGSQESQSWLSNSNNKKDHRTFIQWTIMRSYKWMRKYFYAQMGKDLLIHEVLFSRGKKNHKFPITVCSLLLCKKTARRKNVHLSFSIYLSIILILAMIWDVWGLSSLTRNRTHAPLQWEHRVLTSGQSRKSLYVYYMNISGWQYLRLMLSGASPEDKTVTVGRDMGRRLLLYLPW